MRFIGIVIMLWIVVVLVSATSLAFEDTNAVVGRVRGCLSEGGFVRFSKCEQTSDRFTYDTVTGLFFTVSIDVRKGDRAIELVRTDDETAPFRTCNVLVGFSTVRRPSIMLGNWLGHMTRIPVASCPEYDVIFMTTENPGYRFIDPMWQEFYKRLKKEFPDDPAYRRNDL